MIIYGKQNLNLANLNVPDVYVAVEPPPGFINGAQSNVMAYFGTASWGAMNSPTLMGSPKEMARLFGGITAAALTDAFDLCTDALIAFMQSVAPISLQIMGVRIGDGTEAKSTAALKDTATPTPATGLTITALHPGVLGDQIQIAISAGAFTDTFSAAVIVPFAGAIEKFENLLDDGEGLFWTNLMSAINNGISGVRGPSEFVRASNPNGSAVDPAIGTTTLSGGADGRSSVDKADFIGSPTASPRTGIYSLLGAQPIPSAIACAGLTDNTAFATIQALANQLGAITYFPFATGTSTATALSTRKTLGIDDPNVIFVKDSVNWFDPVNGIVRKVLPTAFIAGRTTVLSPEEAPLNKEVYGVISTERSDSGEHPYDYSEIGQLHDAGIQFITNPIPAGKMFGIRHGQNSSSDPVRSVVEYARMTNFLAHSFDQYMGKFVGRLQSTRPNDTLRAQIKLALDSFLQELSSRDQIDSFRVVCNKDNNPDDMVAKHYLQADVQVRYMSSVKYFIINLTGGTTVVTVGDTTTQGFVQ